MRFSLLAAALASSVAATALHGQEIVEVPASKAGVALPEDLFTLPPGQWFVARQVSQGSEPCTPEACEAGFNSGDLVVSVEHAKDYVRVVAGFRGCQGVAFQEIETGMRPGSNKRGQVAGLIKDVVKGAEKSCKVKAPKVPKLDVSSLFPKSST
jgi:hypothetical protein